MSIENFEIEMKKILASQNIDPNSLNRDFLLSDLDSLTRIEVITFAEEELKIELSNDELYKCKTYGDLLDKIKGEQCLNTLP